jgi:2-amino-4-hydroxy-6-hydroxymethyldihydropteridine diphosphokinase
MLRRMRDDLDPNPDRALAYVALGSNLGDSSQIIRRAIEQLRSLSREPLRISSLWKTSPVDCPPGSPPFINAVAGLVPLARETPESLHQKLKALEASFGRPAHDQRNAPRPLDLDLIAFGAEQRATPALTLPHPRAHQRRFVLQPLCEIEPDLVLPGQNQRIAALLTALDSGEAVERIESV